MFGYVQVRKPELKIKDYDIYRSYYCGLCRALQERYGLRGRVTLTYDLTFLVLLLDAYYEPAVTEQTRRCFVHPLRRHTERRSVVTDYAADMNVLLTYLHFLDDRIDEQSLQALGGLRLYRQAYLRIRDAYPTQCHGVAAALHRLSQIEHQAVTADTPLEAADCFGHLMVAVFRYEPERHPGHGHAAAAPGGMRTDALHRYIDGLALHLGRFLYLMDAYDDFAKDSELGRYNPLSALYRDGNPVAMSAPRQADDGRTDAVPAPRRADDDRTDAVPAPRQADDGRSDTVPAPRQGDGEGTDAVHALLQDEAARCAYYFEKLPCIRNAPILRNILYAGIWNRYDALQDKKKQPSKAALSIQF